jgi:hypothetical protein
MEVVILFLVVIAALLIITSGIWVAIALVSAIFARRNVPAPRCRAGDKNID